MTTDLDEKGLGEALGKLAENKKGEAAAILTNVVVSAATAPFLGPVAAGAGKAAEGFARALAGRISESAITRMLDAGKKFDEERESRLALKRAIAESLQYEMALQRASVGEMREQISEQFFQLINFMRRYLVAPLQEVEQRLQHERPHNASVEVPSAKAKDERILVFVSSGGTCRDPMAKVIAEDLLARQPCPFPIRVVACGLGPLSLPAASSGARLAILRRYKRDLLCEHRAELLSHYAEHADLILTMSMSLLKNVPVTLLGPHGRAFSLKRFLGNEGDIRDPWDGTGAPSPLYDECCRELESLLEAGMPFIIEFLGSRTPVP